MSSNETETILAMVDSIFQNIGYRRYMQGIECLRNEQIYFEICNIVFHNNSIQLIKINQSNLSTGQKLQALINLVSRIINMDLSHISGRLIAEGNINHAKNLLQLFEYLSNYFLIENQNTPSTVRSAPQADSQDQQEDIENLYHTVLATHQEFGYTETDSEADHQNSNKRQENRPRNPSKNKDSARQSNKINNKDKEYSESGSQRLKPAEFTHKNQKQQSNSQKSEVKSQASSRKDKTQPQKSHRRSQESTKARVELPQQFPKKKQNKQTNMLLNNEQTKVAYVNLLYKSIEDLQRKKIKDIRDVYTKKQDEMIKDAWEEQQDIQTNHNKLCKLLSENEQFVGLASANFKVNNKHFSKQLGRVLKASKNLDKEYRLRRLEAKNRELMDIIEDSADIQEMQRMVVEVYKW